MTPGRRLPLLSLLLLSGCATTRSGQGQARSITDCEGLKPPITFEKKVPVKKVTLVGGNELHVLVDTKGCRNRSVELCWRSGVLLTSSPFQVEFFAVGSTEKEPCTEPVTEDVRVFSLDFVNHYLERINQGRVQRCQEHYDDHVLCAIGR